MVRNGPRRALRVCRCCTFDVRKASRYPSARHCCTKRETYEHTSELTAISSITTCSASPCWIGWLSTRSVTMITDPRSIKVKSGNRLHDYLLTELWFTKQATTDLNTCQVDSAKCAGIQFADMLAGVVQGRFEAGRFECFVTLQSKLNLKRLFFTR